jgi:hypothetical protein
MSWKIFSVVWVSAAFAIPQLAAAAERQPPAPAELGQMESILDSCAQAKPRDAERYKKQRAKLTEGVAAKELAKIRSSEPYEEGYDAIRERFDNTSTDEVDKACKVFLGSK